MFYLRKVWPYLLVCFTGAFFYSNTFHVPFQFDDLPYIVNNENIRDINNLSAIWNSIGHPSRFVSFFTFAVNHHIHGYSVEGFHITNIAIHLINACLVFWMISLLLQCSVFKKIMPQKHSQSIALMCALLFVAHPLQTQAVTYIVQRFTSLATLFYLLSVCLFLKGRLSGCRRFFIGLVVSCIAAMFTKQITFTLPFMLLFIEGACVSNFKHMIRFLKTNLWIVGIGLCLVLVIPSFSSFSLERVFGVEVTSGNYEGDVVTASKYFITQPRVIATYLRLFIYPQGQSIDYQFPLSKSLWETKTLAGFTLIFFILIGGIWLYRRSRLAALGIFWFFITLSVESSIIPIHHIIYEHRCYLPSVGIFLCISVIMHYLIQNNLIRWIIIFVVVSILGFLTFQRNIVWQDKTALWENALKSAPNQFKVHDNLGYEYWKSGRYEQALAHFNKAIAINPAYPGVYNNRGGLFADQELYEKAIEDFKFVLRMAPNHRDAHYNLGKVYHDQDMLDEAIKHYTDAIKINPKYSQAYNNRGNAYGERGLYEAALADFNQALVYEEYAYIYYHRAFTLNKMGRVNDAVIDYTKAIGRDPEYVDAYNNRGNMYFRQEQFDLALKDYEKALEYDNKLVHAHYSRGLIFKKRQQLKLAYESFTTVTELDPSNGIAYFQRSLILAAMGQKKEAIKNAKKAELRGYRVDPFYLDYLNETK